MAWLSVAVVVSRSCRIVYAYAGEEKRGMGRRRESRSGVVPYSGKGAYLLRTRDPPVRFGKVWCGQTLSLRHKCIVLLAVRYSVYTIVSQLLWSLSRTITGKHSNIKSNQDQP